MGVPASIIVPTRDRADYLRTALASVAPQARRLGCELLVIDDSGTSSACGVAASADARCIAHPRPLGLNAARNTGVEASSGELVILLDDDVQACDGWLDAFLDGAREHVEVEVFAGAIVPCLEGNPPRSCGREGPPLTALQLGERDVPVRFAWGANMAIRRGALQRIGLFDSSINGQGDEQEWQERLQASGAGEALYLAGARVLHRRAPADARLRALLRGSYRRGAQARRFDARRREPQPIANELVTLAGCAGHVLRYRCPNALTLVAHSAGRLREALAERARELAGVRAQTTPQTEPEPLDDFLSGSSGAVGGLHGLRRELEDRVEDVAELLSGRRRALALASRRLPPRRVLALGVVRERHRTLAERIVAELGRSHHHVEIETCGPGERGKFENLNALLAEHPPDGHDWLIVFDDDVELPARFLDRLVFLAERFELDLAQPAHRRASHAAWEVTRRARGSVARETGFVEIGPLTAFAASTFSQLLPFPPLRMGWGLEAHWAAIAQQRGWRCGVLDAVALSHSAAPPAQAYSRVEALAEARSFLAEHPYLPARETQRTLATHRHW
ncbi:MAG: glycosyltransferase family 2 protein [Solirubrobacteraceae bacterium]